ncbi:MAG TPA: NAD(P)/FAD-dependent oxidoreductase [Candidatus Eremiobacteraceae bacterium]|nr:NAD(P)/FAD-dependent oxidoreductase [Candidatus Eremiobacteraceae bacterium]
MAHRVVILGGGFGGLSAAQRLGSTNLDVTLIDRRNFHLFQPLMYQVATGSLSPGEIAAPLRSVLNRHKNIRVLLGEADDVDPGRHQVILKDGATVEYDSLIVATGADTSYFGHDEWKQWAPSPKSIEEGTEIRHKIFFAFEAAERSSNPQQIRTWLTFVIVGAGATGLELAGALAEIARETLRHDFRSIRPQEARIVLMDAAPRVLPGYPEDLSAKAARLIERLGVEIMTGAAVRGIDGESVTYERNETKGQNGSKDPLLQGSLVERIATRTVLWAGGITATAFGRRVAERTHAESDKSGRIKVKPDLTIPAAPDIYVVGDLALALRPDGRPLPGVAQVAIQQGAYAAKVIKARARGAATVPAFRYFDIGDMAVIGRAAAVANIFGIHLWGLPAWIIWLLVHLMNLVEFQSRILVFVQWGFLYLTYSRGARLITGSAKGE